MKLLFVLFLSIQLYANTTVKFESTFGFLSSGTLLSSFKDARVAVKAWLSKIASEYDGRLHVEFYETSDSLYEDLKKNKVDMIVLDLPYFFKNKADIEKNATNYWSLSMNNTKFAQYYLIAQKSKKYKSFKDIKNKTITIKEGSSVVDVWLDKNALLLHKKSSNKVLKEIKTTRKESTVLLNVFFKKTDFAIVSKKTWETMSELNPSIRKKLEIIEKSNKMHFPFIGAFSKKAAQGSVAAFFNLSKDLKELEGSSQIINLLKFDFIFRIEPDSLKSLEKYYLEYFELKKKYN